MDYTYKDYTFHLLHDGGIWIATTDKTDFCMNAASQAELQSKLQFYVDHIAPFTDMNK